MDGAEAKRHSQTAKSIDKIVPARHNLTMKNKFAALLILLTLLAGTWGCDSFRKPELKFIKAEVDNITFERVTFKMIYEIDNPNAIALNDVSASYQLFLRNKPLVSGEKKSGNLPAQSTSPFVVTLSVRYADMFDGAAGLVSAITGGQKSVPYQFKGSLKSKVTFIDLDMPFDNGGELPLPELPKEQIQNQIKDQLKNIKFN
jgi:LEA14-like dessication related protein